MSRKMQYWSDVRGFLQGITRLDRQEAVPLRTLTVSGKLKPVSLIAACISV